MFIDDSTHWGFPDSSVGKESAYNAGDPSSILGSGRSSGEGIGYPFQYCWPSLVAQLVKNLPAMRETWVLSLDWEDPLEKRKATHYHILAWRILWTVIAHGVSKSLTQLSDFQCVQHRAINYVLLRILLKFFMEISRKSATKDR